MNWKWMLILLGLCMLTFVNSVTWDDEEEEEEDGEDFDFFSTKLDEVPSSKSEKQQCVLTENGESQCSSGVGSLVQRGLIVTKPRVRDILQEHMRTNGVPTSPSFSGEVLGYVTPWNSRGYEWAVEYRHKLTYVAPVWLQIREDVKTKTPIIAGTHDIDREWIVKLRQPSSAASQVPQIIPRVVYERNTLASTDAPIIIDSLVSLATSETFDGFVLEMPIIDGTMDLLLHVGQALRDVDKILILVLTQSSKEGKLPVTHELLHQLLPYVHRFTMNAYDYQIPGPHAPLDWIEKTLSQFTNDEKKQILMGLPFYGYDNHDAIIGSTYIDLLENHQQQVTRLRWDATSHECFHHYEDSSYQRHTVYFPCLQFLVDRLKLFESREMAGTAIWELGQGLSYFYDVF